MLPLDASLARHYNAFKNSIRLQAGVVSGATASTPLYTQGTNVFFTKFPVTNEEVTINSMLVDASFFQTLGTAWKMSPTDPGRLGTRNTLELNEAAVKKLGFTSSPLGQKLNVGQEDEIIGVVKDFHYVSLRQEIDALMLTVVPDTLSAVATYGGCLYVRLDPRGDLPGKVATIGQLYRQ